MPDGHTLLITTESSLVIAPHMGHVHGYDPLKVLAPISLLTRNTIVLVVHPSVPANTLAGVHGAGAAAGQLFYASSGVGGPNHLAGEIFNRMTGLQITHVPFQGTGLALQAVISNQVGAMWGFMAGLIPHIRGGSLRALAVGGKERSPALPDVPTVQEARARLRGYVVDRHVRAGRDLPGPSSICWGTVWLAPCSEPNVRRQSLLRMAPRSLRASPRSFAR